jgi:hypothetical protein
MIRSIAQHISHITIRPAAWKVAAAAVGLALGATSAVAAIVTVAPAVVQFVPANVRLNQTESDVRLIAFNERQCFALPFDLSTDQGVIPKNTKMSSHFVHGDPVTSLLLDGRVRFDNIIIGVISTSALLDASDASCGRAGVTYPALGAELNRGLEAIQADDYTIIDAGRGIAVRMEIPVGSFTDQIRVLTCCGDVCPPVVE